MCVHATKASAEAQKADAKERTNYGRCSARCRAPAAARKMLQVVTDALHARLGSPRSLLGATGCFPTLPPHLGEGTWRSSGRVAVNLAVAGGAGAFEGNNTAGAPG